MPTKPESAAGQRRHHEEPHGPVVVAGEESSGKRIDRRWRAARERPSPHRRCVMSRTSRSRDEGGAGGTARRTAQAPPARASRCSSSTASGCTTPTKVSRRRPTPRHRERRAPHAKRTWSSPSRPGRVPGGGDRLAEAGDEADEQDRREERGGVADVGLVVRAGGDQPVTAPRGGRDGRA